MAHETDPPDFSGKGTQAERLRRDFKLDLRVRGIAGSKTMRLNQGPIDLAHWRDAYAAGGDPVDL